MSKLSAALLCFLFHIGTTQADTGCWWLRCYSRKELIHEFVDIFASIGWSSCGLPRRHTDCALCFVSRYFFVFNNLTFTFHTLGLCLFSNNVSFCTHTHTHWIVDLYGGSLILCVERHNGRESSANVQGVVCRTPWWCTTVNSSHFFTAGAHLMGLSGTWREGDGGGGERERVWGGVSGQRVTRPI